MRSERGIYCALGLAVSLSLFGCSKDNDARAAFGRTHSCPEASVEVKPRTDLKWSTVAMQDRRDEPTDEVKKDPVRLAKWRDDQQKANAPMIEMYDSYDVFSASGCSHDALVGCKRPAKSNGLGNPVICTVVDQKPKTPAK